MKTNFGFIIQCLALVSALVLLQSCTTEAHYFSNLPEQYFDVNAEERDALYPIARYAGMGYNLLRGNPEGDFERGGKDPGILDTHWIFNLTYTLNKEGYLNGETVAVPDQVEFQPSQSCSSKSSTKAYSGQKSYQKQLERSVNLGLSGGILNLANLGFSLSPGMKEVQTKTTDKGQVIVQETKLCNLVSVRYKEELSSVDPQYVLSEEFKNAVKRLPEDYETDNQANEQAYIKFIERWGTHVIVSVELGTRWMERQSASYSEVYNYLSKQKKIGGSVNAGIVVKGIGASGNIGIDLNQINNNVNKYTSIGNSNSTLTIGSKQYPAPIKFLELTPISDVIKKRLWGTSWEEDRVDLKQKNLRRALNMYPNITGASIEDDPLVTVHPKLNWLSGTFALPQPRTGCPEGFNFGYVKQDTHNGLFRHNSWSVGIKNRLKVDANAKYITTHFCVKKERELRNEMQWPSGSYCIARKAEQCPSGFGEGFIKWDDKDIFNKNYRFGALPDGKFDKNTKIFFCCRGDGKASKPIQMPLNDSFVFYRYGGQCQAVANMTVSEDYILWSDELLRNKDERSGEHPDDDGGKRKHKLHYCYYSLSNN